MHGKQKGRKTLSIEEFENLIKEKLDLSGSDKISFHNYHPAYAEFLYEVNINSILEIGIANGHAGYGETSISAWKAIYPEAKVYAIDIVEEKVKMVNDGGYAKAYVVDQSSTESIQKFIKDSEIKELDMILDDGSHVFEHARITFETLFDLISDDGIYMIEDVFKGNHNGQQTVQQWEDYLKSIEDIEFEIIDTLPNKQDDSIVIGIWKA
jgi:hypothetical protein